MTCLAEDDSGVRADAGCDVTVVVPAFNEALVIEDCLRGVFNQVTERRIEVIVVANGCTDATAARARCMSREAEACGVRLLVLEQSTGNKPFALNLAEQHASGRVRMYLDADIRISPNVVEEVCSTLIDGGALLCAPRLRVAPARSAVTRAYAAIWGELPVVCSEVVGCGLYAVSMAGRARWGAFPELISDDKFVRLHFTRQEQAIADRAEYVVQMPEGSWELVRVRGRWSRGNRDLAKARPDLVRLEPNRALEAARLLLRTPRLWSAAPVFILAFALGEMLAVWSGRKGLTVWERANRARVQLSAQGARKARLGSASSHG